MEQWSDPDPGSGIKHPGSAILPRIEIFVDTFSIEGMFKKYYIINFE
jgi:hypothetical protein